VREIGVLQPVLVRPASEAGTYELIAGERRWRAARRAGLAVIPAVVRTTDDLGSVERALVENLHRQDLTPLEEASAYQQLIEDFSLTHEQVSSRVGQEPFLGHQHAAPPVAACRHPGTAGRWSLVGRSCEGVVGHTRPRVPGAVGAQSGHRELVGAHAWRRPCAIEVAVPSPTNRQKPAAPASAMVPVFRARRGCGRPGLLELEELLAEYLSTRVSVTMGTNKGKVVIEFADLEDLERIYHHMTTASEAQRLVSHSEYKLP
jgi:ParB family chromosome partitioning protein